MRAVRPHRQHDGGDAASPSSRVSTRCSSAPWGTPGLPDHVSLWGLLIPIRRQFRQYVNLRPVRLWPGVRTPLADRRPSDIDFVIVRENNEGEYSEIGGRLYAGTPGELAVQQSVFTRGGRRPGAAVRLRTGAGAARAASDFGDQVERHHPHHAVLGRALRGDGRRVSRRADRPVPHRHPVRAPRSASRLVRRHRREQPVRRHPVRPRPGRGRIDRTRPRRESQPRPHASLDVRARPRVGSGHRRQGRRQPRRPDADRGDDAGASGRGAGRGRDRGGGGAGAGRRRSPHRRPSAAPRPRPT